MSLNEQQEQLCDSSSWDFSDLKAMFLNCTLKRSPELSHTEGLIQICKQIMEKNVFRLACSAATCVSAVALGWC